jgi:heme/copper-type cytochrome/quinol oxidase subunit 2
MAKARSRKEARLTRLSVTLAAAALLAGPAYLFQKPLAGEDGEIRVTARKYEFVPSVIKVKRGDHIRLVITALDRDHGFKLEAFQIDQKLAKGEAVTVEFNADQAGTFPFECSHFCGLGHQKMKGQLTVE